VGKEKTKSDEVVIQERRDAQRGMDLPMDVLAAGVRVPCCYGVAAFGYNYKKRMRVAFPNRLKVAASIFLERGSINPARRLEFSMWTMNMKFAVLLSLGLASSSWASPRDPFSQPIQENEAARLTEPRQKPVTLPVPVQARGQLLYENHCTVCHASVVHLRTDRRAQSLPEIRTGVMHWSGYLKLRWGKEEVDDVVNHLNRQFYKFESR